MNWIVKNKFTIIRSLFLVPIILVAFISISHVISWYDLSNPFGWAVYLSVAVEIAAMVSLAAATSKIKGGVWFVFGVVTLIQFIGNIFFSYKEINPNSVEFKQWIELVGPLFENFGTQTTDFIGHKRWLSLLSGGLLPIISLTSLHFFVKYDKSKSVVEEEPRAEVKTKEFKKEVRIDEDNLGDINYYIKSDDNDYFEREEIEELIVENEIISEENNQESLQDTPQEAPQDTINRNFSVNIPDRKKNQIQRIGSNKEIRDGDNGTIFFNKK
jgi:hypothetical protein